MKKIITLILCILYTFVTIGGSVFVHQCGDNSQLSIYEKHSHSTCPICSHSNENKSKSNPCKDGTCKDVEIKINQLSDKLFSANKSGKINLQPMIIQRLWIELFVLGFELPHLKPSSALVFTPLNNDPPGYILNCNFRN